MSLATYGGLKTALGKWLLERGTDDITDRVPEFFQLARTRIFYGCSEPGFESQPLRIRFMETSADLTIDGNDVDLPDGFLQQRRLYIDSTAPMPAPEFLAPSAFRDRFPTGDTTTGYPRYYTVEGDVMVFGPLPDTTYTGKLLYYKIPDALSADADSDWLTQNAPGVYLFSAMTEFAWFDGSDDDLAMKYAARFAGAVNSLMYADALDRWSGAKMTARPAGPTP